MNKPPETAPLAGARLPGATYRLQFNADFTLGQGAEIVPYLRDLGITDAYASPLFQAAPGSTHGYDICCFTTVSRAIGGREAFDLFAGRLRKEKLGLLLDMVPNHMGNDLSNGWWYDVLQQGPRSAYASYFDIDWQPPHTDLRDKVLLPTLGDHYAKVLADGQLQVIFADGEFAIAYYDKHFPVALESYAGLLDQVAHELSGQNDAREAISAIKTLSGSVAAPLGRSAAGEFGKMKAVLEQWHRASAAFRDAIARVLTHYRGTPGRPETFHALHRLLQTQHYRLAYWKVGPEEINYRRFFDVTQLVSVRMELPEVFEAAHDLVFEFLRDGKVTGLRIDHPDGLWNPREYFERLQQASGGTQKLYVVAEKILSGDETLLADWPVHGTTGYDYLVRANGVFVEGANAGAFDRIYARYAEGNQDFAAHVYRSKKKILTESLVSELQALAHRLREIARSTRAGLDFTFSQLCAACVELIAAFPVYRSYITEQTEKPSAGDLDHINEAVVRARHNAPGMDTAVIEFVASLLRLEWPADMSDASRQRARQWVLRFQQLSGPATAKGLEDTAFYNYNRLVSLNEVGGNPGEFGVSVERFHEYNTMKARSWPHSLLASATHDTKRGEDLRARLNVLSEIPEVWDRALKRWQRLNAPKKSWLDGHPAPHPNDEYLLYQMLVGAWPATKAESISDWLPGFRWRMVAYMAKAVKEAKARTSWTEPNTAYENAITRFVEQVLDEGASNDFLSDLRSFQRPIAFFGQINSLAQTVLKIASPGVPDFYQGTELWDLNLVDPDNRRPVDYAQRQRMLNEVRTFAENLPAACARFWAERHTGAVKLFAIWRALTARAAHRDIFELGDYVPLPAEGRCARHLCAFARQRDGKCIVAVVPRLLCTLAGGASGKPRSTLWTDTTVPLPSVQSLRNVFTGEVVPSPDNLDPGVLFRHFPVALLVPA